MTKNPYGRHGRPLTDADLKCALEYAAGFISLAQLAERRGYGTRQSAHQWAASVLLKGVREHRLVYVDQEAA